MKKFVIIAFIFALVAGAAFAQDGEWSVSGKGEIGTMLNFLNKQPKDNILFDRAGQTLLVDNDKPYVLIGSNGYNNIEYYGMIGGGLGLTYSLNGLSASINFNGEKNDTGLAGSMSYSDDARAFTYDVNLKDILDGSFKTGRLWGYYKFLDGVIHLEAAQNSRDTNYWMSNDVVADLFIWPNVITRGDWNDYAGGGRAIGGVDGMDFGNGFMKVDHHNYLLADITPASLIDGLNFGVMIPGVFAAANQQPWEGGGWDSGSPNAGVPGYYDAQEGNVNRPFLDNTLLRSRLGVKFATGPFEIAAHFALLGRSTKQEITTEKAFLTLGNGETKEVELKKKQDVLKQELKGNSTDDYWKDPVLRLNTGLYLGAKFNINDNLNAGLGFEGIFWSKTPQLGFGVSLGFNSGPFGASLLAGLYTHLNPVEDIAPVLKTSAGEDKEYSEIKYSSVLPGYEIDTDKDEYVFSENDTRLGVKPGITFNIVENYLAASLDTYLYWRLGLEQRAYRGDVFGYEVTPQLWFNVAGTGAGKGYWWPNTTAIIVRYKIGGWINGKEIRTIQKSNKDVDSQTSPMYNGVDVTFKWSF